MRRKYSPLPVMRHKYPAKLRFQRAGERTRTARRCMPFSGARIQRLGLSRQRLVGGRVGEGRTEGKREGGEALIEFPQRGGTTRWLSWVARPPCKERGGDRCDATGSQAVATRALLPLGTPGSHGGGQRSVGHGRCASFSGGVVRAGRSRLRLGALCLFFCVCVCVRVRFFIFLSCSPSSAP